MSRYNYSCIHECGDEDCGKCFKRGIIFECPPGCTDYEPNMPRMDRQKPTPKPSAEQTLARIEGVIKGCEDILNSPESTAFIKKCAIDTAYKHIAKIIKGE